MIIMYKTKAQRRNLYIAILLMMLVPVGFYIYILLKVVYAKRYYEEIKRSELVYTYDTLYRTLNRAYYIEDLKYRDDIISFYKDFQKIDTPYITFPIKQLPFNKKIFKVKTIDSLLVEVVDFDTLCWGYVHGYVYKGSVFSTLPEKSLLEDRAVADEYRRVINSKIKRRKRSVYGVQCECQW